MGGDDEADIHPRLKEFKQKQREVRCAVNLAEKLQVCLDNGEEEFTRQAVEEANELGQSAFGGTLLNVIGTTYVEQVGDWTHHVCVRACVCVCVCEILKMVDEFLSLIESVGIACKISI